MGVSYHTSVIQKDGSLWTWGRNSYGQLGDNTTVNKLIPTKIGTDKWKQISVGSQHTVGIQKDGSLWAWGYNYYGQLGDNTTVDQLVPIKIGTDKWKQISAGQYHSVGIQEDGSLWAWGYNYYSQLGDNTTVNKLIPIKIGDAKWKQISTGTSHTVGIQEDGSLWAWGRNNYGQLGDNTKVNKSIPTKIDIAKWKQISTGTIHTVGIQEDGSLWAWGYNNYGQLGDNTVVDKSVPTKIGDVKWKQITAGASHTVGIQEDGSLWVWGYNVYGQLGDNTKVDKSVPTKIGTAKWKQITAGQYHTVGLQEDDSLWVWGRNSYGQLGDNTVVDKLVPTKIDIDKVAILMDIILSIVNKSFLLSRDGYKKWMPKSNNYLVYSDIDAVPTMTSNTSGIITISASGTYSNTYDPYESFNDTSIDATDAWVSANGTTVNAWIKVDFGEVKKIGKYSMKNRGTNEFPSGWKLQGSNDNSNWTELDIRTSETTLQIASAKTTFVNNTSFGGYRYYRILITAFSGSSTYIGIGEIELFEVSIVPATYPSFQTVSSTLPTITQFQEEGMDDLSVLGRKVQTVMESPKAMTSEVLGEGKVYKTSVNLKKYFDLRKIEVK